VQANLALPSPTAVPEATMYVCVCNAVTEKDVHTCVAAGAGSAGQVKKACGWKPGCGACTARLSEVVRQAREAGFETTESTAA
jgi:bacterioferritin-associated ferredoxin